MKLNLLMTLRADLRIADNVGNGPFGQRRIVEVIGGIFEGSRLQGKVVTPSADWILIDTNEVGHIDVRLNLKTTDDAHIYMQYYGILEFNEKVKNALAESGEIDFGDTYFMTQPRFETGDSRYAWLNNIIAVAEGRIATRAVEYKVFECVNG